jgi:hypothetical protein
MGRALARIPRLTTIAAKSTREPPCMQLPYCPCPFRPTNIVVALFSYKPTKNHVIHRHGRNWGVATIVLAGGRQWDFGGVFGGSPRYGGTDAPQFDDVMPGVDGIDRRCITSAMEPPYLWQNHPNYSSLSA